MTDKTALTTTATRLNYADAISDAIADAEEVLGPQFLVKRVKCVAVVQPSSSDPDRITGYVATVESTGIEE